MALTVAPNQKLMRKIIDAASNPRAAEVHFGVITDSVGHTGAGNSNGTVTVTLTSGAHKCYVLIDGSTIPVLCRWLDGYGPNYGDHVALLKVGADGRVAQSYLVAGALGTNPDSPILDILAGNGISTTGGQDPTLAVKVDGTSINFNASGELEINQIVDSGSHSIPTSTLSYTFVPQANTRACQIMTPGSSGLPNVGSGYGRLPVKALDRTIFEFPVAGNAYGVTVSWASGILPASNTWHITEMVEWDQHVPGVTMPITVPNPGAGVSSWSYTLPTRARLRGLRFTAVTDSTSGNRSWNLLVPNAWWWDGVSCGASQPANTTYQYSMWIGATNFNSQYIIPDWGFIPGGFGIEVLNAGTVGAGDQLENIVLMVEPG